MSVIFLFAIHRAESFEVLRLPLNQKDTVEITGAIRGFSESKKLLRRYLVDIDQIQSKESHITVNQNSVYLYVPYFKYFPQGSQVEITASINPVESFLTESGKIFHYDRFLATKDVIGSIYYPRRITVLTELEKKEKILLNIKKTFVDKINTLFSFPNAPLLAGVLFGAVDTLGEERLDNFRIAGLIHIVVLSGSNIAIIIEAVRRSIPVSRMYSIGIAGTFIVLFVLMVGAEASIVRAAIMAFISLLAQATYSRYSVHRALWMTVVVMVAWNPGILLYDPSFILSVLATIGMVYLNPVLEKKFTKIPEKFEIRFIIASTCATYFLVLPYIVYSMGKVSVVSLGVNLITLPLVPWVMLGGFVATSGSFISEKIMKPIIFISEMLLTYIQKIVTYAAKLPFAEFSFTISSNTMLIGYCFLGVLLRVMYVQSNKNQDADM